MAFGFDASLILGANKVHEPTPNETLQTLSDIALRRSQQQHMQATLADMLRQRQQEESLASIYKQNANSFSDPTASRLALGGFGKQAYAAQEQAEQMRTKELEQRKADESLRQLHRSLILNQAAAVKTPDEYARFIARVSPQGRAELGLPEQYDQAALDSLIGGEVPIVERAKLDAAAREKGLDRSSLEKRTRIAAGAGGGSIELSPDAIDTQARMYIQTGTLAPLGMGKAAAANRNAILNRVAQLDPTADIGGNKSSFHADSASLQDAQKLADAMDRNEAKARGDIEVLRSKTKDVFDSGSPLLNAPGRALAEKAGDPKVAAFNTARTAAINQINKVLSATAGSGALSDSSRHEAEELVKKDASLAQLDATFDVLMQDMERNKAAMHQSVKDIRARMSGGQSRDSAKQVTAYRYNKDRTKRVAVYSDGTQGEPEAANGR